MASPENADGHMSGDDMCAYAETFSERFLQGRFRYSTHVRKLRRLTDGWWLDTVNVVTGVEERLHYEKLVLCTGVSTYSSSFRSQILTLHRLGLPCSSCSRVPTSFQRSRIRIRRSSLPL